MSTIPHSEFSAASLPREELPDRSRKLLNELAGLVQLKSGSERATLAVAEGVSILGAAACVVQTVGSLNDDRLSFLRCRVEIDPATVEPIAFALTAKVAHAGIPLIVSELSELFGNDDWLAECGVHSYLGVPIFSPDGSVSAVVGMLGGENQFGKEDECWLTVVGQLVMESLARELHAVGHQKAVGQLTVAAPDLHQQTILVVDDDRGVNDFLCEFLTGMGYRVEAAFNGQEAVQSFQPAKHDLVITDIAMPFMNGWELIAALRSRNPELPIVLISGYGLGEFDKSNCSRPAVSAMLKKPLAVAELAAIVSRLFPISSRISIRDFGV